MAIDLTFYALKLHSATRYKDLAMEVKGYSAALAARIDKWSRQDELAATNLAQAEVDGERHIEAVVPLPLHLPEDPDREPEDAAFEAVKMIHAHEAFMEGLSRKYDKPAYEQISAYRKNMLVDIDKYMRDGSLFGQVPGQGFAWWECNDCGWFHHSVPAERGKKAFPPDECPSCGAKISAFMHHQQIGGW